MEKQKRSIEHEEINDYDDYCKRNRVENDFDDRKMQILDVIKREFQNEINKREEEVHFIQNQLLKAQKTLHLLKYVIIKSFYDRKSLKLITSDEANVHANISREYTNIQNRIHPAVKKIIGKKPVDLNFSSLSRTRVKTPQITEETISNSSSSSSNFVPAINHEITATTPVNEENVSRGNRKKTKHVIIVGNISKYSPSDKPQDDSSHKWMMYVRGPRDNPDVSHIIKKVRFFLHPSYQPNDVIEIEESPFHLSRRGWGEFPLRVQIHFQCSYNNPIDVIHNLKLDQTKSGRQTLGNETLLNVWLYNNELLNDEEFPKAKYSKQEISAQDAKSLDENNENVNFNLNDKFSTTIKISKEIKEMDIIHNNSNFQIIKNESINNVTESTNQEHIANKNNILLTSQQYEIELENNTENKYNFLLDPNATYDEDNIFLVDHCYTNNIVLQNFVLDTKKYKIKVPVEKFNSSRQIVYYLFKSLPIVTNLANNLTYKYCYPYTATSLSEYATWNIGKQRCSEWYRAKEIKKHLTEIKISDLNLWTTKFIIMFGRAHAFTPFANYEIFRKKNEASKTIPINQGILENQSTYTEFMSISNLMQELNLYKEKETQDNFVDIENNNVNEEPRIEKNTRKEIITSENDKNLKPLCTFVRQCTEDINITLEDEEIEPGVFHNTAERILLQAVKCLAEELIRTSLANKIIGNKGRITDHSINRNDICKVILEREEFDIFTNDGLGKQIDSLFSK